MIKDFRICSQIMCHGLLSNVNNFLESVFSALLVDAAAITCQYCVPYSL